MKVWITIGVICGPSLSVCGRHVRCSINISFTFFIYICLFINTVWQQLGAVISVFWGLQNVGIVVMHILMSMDGYKAYLLIMLCFFICLETKREIWFMEVDFNGSFRRKNKQNYSDILFKSTGVSYFLWLMLYFFVKSLLSKVKYSSSIF